MLSPATPIDIDENVRLTTVGTGGYFATMDRDGAAGSYTITALTPVFGTGEGQLNESDLKNTSTDYPPEIKQLYVGGVESSLGPETLKLEQKILDAADKAGSRAPIELAQQTLDELLSSTYKYSTDIRSLDCATLSTAECFATYKTGFCQYYATTMAVILRDLGVPARIAEGFQPGSRDVNSATEQILFSNAHAWVEVYFVGYGWVPFDPTGNNLAHFPALPVGSPTASGTPRPISSHSAPPIPEATNRDPIPNRPGARDLRRAGVARAARRGARAVARGRRWGRVHRRGSAAAGCHHGRWRLRHGHPDRVAVRVRAAPGADRL